MAGKRHKLVPSEQVAWDHFTGCGWELLRNGWPDFLGIAPTGEVMGIEVKGPTDRLAPEQQDIAAVLRVAGVSTKVAYVVEGAVVVANPGAARPLDTELHDAAARLDAYVSRSGSVAGD